MDLLLWRHAKAVDADESINDLKRPLTQEGEVQAKEMAAWLRRNMPADIRVVSSPALRTRQTVLHLSTKHHLSEQIAPNASVADVLKEAGWKDGKQPVLLVGHQPTLGMVAQQLLGTNMPCSIKKGAVWWLRRRVREGQTQVVLMAVQNPSLL